MVYAFAGAAWAIAGPESAGKVLLAILMILWVLSIASLTKAKDAPIEAGVFASLLLFNHAFYWGFLNYLVGFPVFVLWFILTTKKPRERLSWFSLFFLMLTGLFLLWAHALWFAVGAGWLVLHGLFRRIPWKVFLIRLLSLLPGVIYSLIWYPKLSSSRAESGFDVVPRWFDLPWERLAPGKLLNAVWGGVKGTIEPVFFVCLVLWIGGAIGLQLLTKHGRLNVDLALAAGMFLAIGFIAPDKYMNTIYFASRWIPCGIIFLLLALPPPLTRKRMGLTLAVVLVAAFCFTTGMKWNCYSTQELSGLDRALEALPESPRLLGLDFVKESQFIKGRPFLQMFAYGQVLKEGILNFSFSEHFSGIVAYRPGWRADWTPGMEWFAERIRQTDLQHFDHVLVNGDDAVHGQFLSKPELEALTTEGSWRLYKIRPEHL